MTNAEFEAPPGFATIHLQDEQGKDFPIVGSSPPLSYELGLLSGNLWGTPHVVWLARQLLGENGTFIDIGANIGCVSIPIALDGHDVIAVEMIPANCLKLHLGRLANRLPNLTIFQMAASSEDGSLEFGGTEAWGVVGHGNQLAASMKLDTLVQLASLGLHSPSETIVVKIDVEGHELSVLTGAQAFIEKSRPIIIFESIQSAADGPESMAVQCKELLAATGYRLFLQYRRALVPRTARELQEGLVSDFLAVPEEKLGLMQSLEVRPLTQEERLSIIAVDAAEELPLHSKHAQAAILRMQPAPRPYPREDGDCR